MNSDIYSTVLETHKPFRIARGASSTYNRVFVKLESDDYTGYGEAACSSYYGETPDTAAAALKIFLNSLPADPFNREHMYNSWTRILRGHYSARAALDMAVLDLAGRMTNLPLYSLYGLKRPERMLTSITLSLDTPLTMASDARDKKADCIKIKAGGDGLDLDRVSAIRKACPESRLRIDANCSWSPGETVSLAPQLASLGIEMIEQPVPPGDNAALSWIRDRITIPLFADESVETSAQIRDLRGAVDGINIKLAKCGGPGEALKMIHAARALGLKTMLGCMVESSLGIAAALHLSTLVDYLDLDGHLFLKNDPWKGIQFEEGGYLSLSNSPGLGVVSA